MNAGGAELSGLLSAPGFVHGPRVMPAEVTHGLPHACGLDFAGCWKSQGAQRIAETSQTIMRCPI